MIKIILMILFIYSIYCLYVFLEFKNTYSTKATIKDIIPVIDKFEKNIINYHYTLSFKHNNKTIVAKTPDLYFPNKYSIGNKIKITFQEDPEIKINYLEEKHSKIFFFTLNLINKMKKRG